MLTINKLLFLYLTSLLIASVLAIPLYKNDANPERATGKATSKRAAQDYSPHEAREQNETKETTISAMPKSSKNNSAIAFTFSRLDSCSMPPVDVQRICKITHPIPTLVYKYNRYFINKITAHLNMNEFESFDSLSYCNAHILELLCHAYFPKCDAASQTVEYFVSEPTCVNVLNECGGPVYQDRSDQFCQQLKQGRHSLHSCTLPKRTNIGTCTTVNYGRSIPSWFESSLQMADNSAQTIFHLLKYIIPSSQPGNTCESKIIDFICDGALFCSNDNRSALTVSSKQKCRDVIKCGSYYQQLMLKSICDSYLDENEVESLPI
ncbi:uncharacterized protein TRIADDRAFT_52017 [Trichoplax adhaerens]|uniref:FZ domain-containing protein n=1 Tax=Trichoplax adhaerens TaxID=10228 RepID=B3RLI8_TRIAD|nr:predicted protein [Trichoplax adhaerens]EDV29544.1 predicted protein [Trichoplax adhaerens]|eukprot:XP_002108746.1 predicted protein [Trichoplax adhaerens]